ncbi:MAG: hypothetical protein HYU69_17515 [Bacteroidetes bacterium]|nr:hypothetical protein [Bacteroidota bacterium]
MKRSGSISIMCCGVFVCFSNIKAQNKVLDLESEKVKANKIKSVSEFRSEFGKGEFKKAYTKYDSLANVIEHAVFYTNGNIEEKKTFSYNDKGLVKEELHYNTSGLVESIIKYLYDAEKVG